MSAPTITSVSPLGQAFASVGPESAAQISDALGAFHANDGPLGEAKSAWVAVEAIPQRLLDLLDGSRDIGMHNPIVKIRDVLTNPHLNDAGREQQTTAILNGLRSETSTLATQLRAALDTFEATLRDASLPKRPTGADVSVRIADAKSDLRMIFGPLDGPAAMNRKAAELLERALVDGDDAMAWVLTSPWAEDYQRSRWPSVDHASAGSGQALSETLGRVLDQHGGPAVTRARQALDSTSRPATALRMLTGQLPKVIDAVAREARIAARSFRP